MAFVRCASQITLQSVRWASSIPKTIKLNAGNSMPTVGLGTWKSPAGKTGKAVQVAVEAGYRALDTANDYGNEAEIGKALRELFDAGVVKREEMFIQSKLWNSNHRPEHVLPDLQATLDDLQLDYVDCFLIHWPQACPSSGKAPALCKDGPSAGHVSEGTMFPILDDGTYSSDNESHFMDAWWAMEELADKGLCKSLGVSNFNRAQITHVMEKSKKHKVSVLQNECHLYLQNKDLLDFCQMHNIVFQAYSPLGSYDRPWAKSGSITSGPPISGVELLDDPRLKTIASKYGKTSAQVVINWHLSRGVAVVPKSITPSRIQENFQVFDFALDAEDMQTLSQMNIGWRHLLWAETSKHPDYPFKDDLPPDYKIGKAPTNTGKEGQ